MTDEAIKSLQRIAWLTNQYLGGGCCEDHARQNENLLLDELAKFEDDSFEVLKSDDVRIGPIRGAIWG